MNNKIYRRNENSIIMMNKASDCEQSSITAGERYFRNLGKYQEDTGISLQFSSKGYNMISI